MSFEAVIGLEVHAQLSTQSKLFCGCPTTFGAAPNANSCPVCLGMPGVLPVANGRAVELALRAALGLNCTVHLHSQWSRKNYFYPDLCKGYQISQYDRPIATHGTLRIQLEDGSERDIHIDRIHMEEDAGKNVHDAQLAGERSFVDFNRAGIPLVEIVSAPELRSSEEAAAYLKALRQILRYLDACDGNMEEGSLRCDANVSIRPTGSKTLGTRTELKNINSFRFVQQAIDYEIQRQIHVVESGGSIEQETRLWDSHAKVTRSMRKKEDAHDYRYFPDPDLPELVVEEAFLERIKRELPELPAEKKARYEQTFGLSAYDAGVLTDDQELALYFEASLKYHDNAKALTNWIINDLVREAKGAPISTLKATPQHIAELVALIDKGLISGKIAKKIFVEMLESGETPQAIVDAKGLKQVSDSSTLEPLIDDILAKNPQSIDAYKAGKTNVVGFFVGQVMKATRGQANPQMVNKLLQEKLNQLIS